MSQCPICQDRGFIVDNEKHQKKCVCQVKRELELFLAPVIQYPLVKTTDFTQFDKRVLFTAGTLEGFGSLVKSYLFRYYFESNQSPRGLYELCTGNTIMEAYLNPEKLHTKYYTLPLLFLNLTSYYTNRAMGEVLVYALEQRVSRGLPFWIYTGYLSRDDIDHHYNGGLRNYLAKLPRVSIDAYSKNLAKDNEEF